MALNQTFNQDASGNEVVTGPITDTQIRATPLPVSGTVAVTGALTDTQIRATPLPISGTVSTTAVTAATATLSNVALAITTTSLLASNASRKGLALMNDSTAISYVAFAATASITAFTVKMQPGSYYENNTLYTGALSVIASSAAGAMRVTELT